MWAWVCCVEIIICHEQHQLSLRPIVSEENIVNLVASLHPRL